MTLAPFIAIVSGDGRTARMKCGAWSMSCPAADLPKWLAFYRDLIRRRPASARFYDPCVAAIEGAMRRAGMAVPPEPMNARTR